MPSVTCPNCQTVVVAGTPSCPGCGSSLAGIRPAGATPQMKFDASALTQTDRIVGTATIVLFISLFLPWYSASAGGFGGTANALSPHGYMYIVLILSVAMITMLALEALGTWKLPASAPLTRSQILLAGTTINALLVIIAFVFKPSGENIVTVGWSFGAFVGLVAAFVALVPLARPALQSLQGK
jgi:hypothetical protein